MAKNKQGYLPGAEHMAPPSFRDIDDAAESYVEARNDWQERGATMNDLHADLLALMKEHDLKVYEFNGSVITVDATERVHVRKKKQPKESE